MALETSHTDSSTPSKRKTARPNKTTKAARRRPPAAENETPARPAEPAAAAQPEPAAAQAVQVDVAEFAAGTESIGLRPSRRVRVRRADTGPGTKPEPQPAPESASNASTSVIAGAADAAKAEAPAQKRSRGRGRRSGRARRDTREPGAPLPTSPAEAIDAARAARAPDRETLEAAAVPEPELLELRMAPAEALFEAEATRPEDEIITEPPPPQVLIEERPVGEEITTVEPEVEPGAEPEEGLRRRRRGRRGRRGARRPGQQGPTDQRPAAAPARPQPAPKSAAPIEVPAEDEEAAVSMDELEQDLGPELEVTSFSDRTKTKGALGREMIINVSAGFECRIAILHEGRLEELFIERESTQSHVGNIYKGRVTNVEPSIQAAFIDFGLEKNGFLHISDVQPQYFPDHKGGAEDVGRKIPRHQRPPIQKCFRRGQEVIVQITKEGVGTKGPTLTSYLSIPGRYLVMMPGMSHTGVSRKIEDEVARKRMREVLSQLVLPKGIGFILRTAGLDRPKRELQRDLNYLLRLWKTVVDRIRRQNAPAELYRESDLVIRTLRDVYASDFARIVVDDAVTAKKVREFLRIAMPRTKAAIELYTDREPLFHRLGIEAEIERINMRHVPLLSGGSLVIDSTEAMVAIDVNSGRFRTLDDAEETALRINLEAAEEIARQLRLRDLGGLIVCDFIDMRLERNKRKVEGALREALKKHKERARILRMSAFGLIEMTRQRQGPSIRRNIYHDCPHCRGAGQVKLPESVMLDAMRMIQLAAHQEHVHKIMISLAPDVAYTLLNRKRAVLNQIEAETDKRVFITGKPEFTSDQMELLCEDSRGREVTVAGGAAPAAR
jgi:ribonuclease E